MTASIDAWPMYRALVGIGVGCGLLIALVYVGTLPHIERQRAAALEQAVFAVLPGSASRRTFVFDAAGTLVPDTGSDGSRIHAGYDAAGRLLGVAIEAEGMGYADTIEILYGYVPADERIVGLRVLASKETPGLGDKIETDERYQANFAALDVRLDAAGEALVNPIAVVKPGTKSNAWEIDGITGATISAQAVGNTVAASAARWLPAVRRNREVLAAGGQHDES